MKKIISTLLVVVFALSFMFITVSADDFNTIDSAGLLTADEIQALEQLAVDIEADYGYCAMICFTDNINGYDSVRDYGEMLYNNYADCEDAIIFVHDLNQNICDFFILEGKEEKVFDYDVTDPIFEAYNTAENYYLGANIFYNLVYGALSDAGVSGTDSAIDEPTSEDAAEEATQVIKSERVLPLVVDNADILTDDEEAYFLERCQTFTDEYKCEIAIVTIIDTEGKTVQEYADDFYDYNGYGYGENRDGLLCVYLDGEEGKRNATLTTYGTAQLNIGDDEIEDILLAIAGSAKFGEFKDAFDWYIDLSEEAVKPMPPLFWLLICLAVGMVIGLIITNSMASKNYSVHKKETAADYVREGTLMITGRNDVFKNTRVNVTPKPKSNSGSSSDSGGSTHTSSSGRSHGGGSISF